MAITSTQTNGIDRVQSAQGSYLDDAGTDTPDIEVGFTPRYVQVVNQTDQITFEWYEGMTADHCIKTVAAGTRTAETSGGITVNADNRSFGFPVLTNKQYRWVAHS